MFSRFLIPATLALIGLLPTVAQAGKYDLDLTKLGELRGTDAFVTQDNSGFRSLASELGVVMAPKPTDPADSLGLAGFAITTDVSLNTISQSAGFWDDSARGDADRIVPTLQLLGRKGLWPGLEVGAGATKLFDSRMWTVAGYGKAALHEGFHHLPIPTIALRGMFSRVLGAKDLFLTTMSVGGSLSHVFGIGSTFHISPYAGFDALFIIAHSNVLDATPGVDEYDNQQLGVPPTGRDHEFVFRRQDPITRMRPYGGFRVVFSVLRVGFEAMFALPGSSSDVVPVGNGTTETAVDNSALQQQYSFTVGLDF
ncbi:MAG: hypothetical protein B7733_05170 [Myxococcales bacterium FL481]|nr:MAG: hypothetical protein B7733_05170 [Myxococcales bacterium FL481]